MLTPRQQTRILMEVNYREIRSIEDPVVGYLQKQAIRVAKMRLMLSI
jgi:hypothetical protein